MRIVVLVKHVPEPTATWSFAPDLTLDRATVEGRLSELDEYAVEQAVRLVEGGLDAEIVCLTMGPAGGRRRAAQGARDGRRRGRPRRATTRSTAPTRWRTSLVLAEAIEQTGFDLVADRDGSTDAEMSVVPSMVADRLGVNQATFAGELAVADGVVSIRRESDAGSEQVSAALPAVVSVTDQTGEARYPAFKAIMIGQEEARHDADSLADLGIDPSRVGLAGAATRVVARRAGPRPRRRRPWSTDDGTGGRPARRLPRLAGACCEPPTDHQPRLRRSSPCPKCSSWSTRPPRPTAASARPPWSC